MHILMHNDVDDYPSSMGKWAERPTKEQLVEVLKHYHKNADELAEELVSSGCCNVQNSSCTSYEIQSI